MKHQAHVRKFGRPSGARKAMFRSLATSLLKHDRIQTTIEKAKDLRPIVEKLVTLAKKDDLHRRRQAYSYLLDKAVVQRLFTEVGPKYGTVNGGYTRVVRSEFRHGDAAQLAVIELREVTAPKKKKAAKKPAAKKAEAAESAVEATPA